MSSLTIDDKGTEFFYLDSGQPESEIYTTVVLIHGHTFHSGVFKRLLPIVASKGLRLICPNRRDYAGTTLYSPSELRALSDGNEKERAAFLEARGIEIALFMCRLIEKYSLPMPTRERDDGGLALAGWSLGNTVPLAAIAAVSSFPKELKLQLQMYLRRLIVFEPPSLSLGFENPPKHYNPLLDESIPEEHRSAAFSHWVSSYWTHGDLSSHNLDNLTYRHPDPSRKASISTMTPEDFGAIMDVAPVPRSDAFLGTRFDAQFYQQTCNALFNPAIRAAWQQSGFWVLYGDSAPWNVIHSAWEIEKRSEASKKQVKFSVLKGANHFMAWDEPERTVDAVLYCLQN